MKDDYLWDRSGPPDPEIARLEEALAQWRYQPAAGFRGAAPRRPWSAPGARWMALAAALLVAISTWLMKVAPSVPTAWQVARVEGAAQVGRQAATVSMALGAGQVLRTGSGAALTLQADAMGTLDIGPDSELSAASNRRVELRHGALHAFIWARPRQFVVNTPSASAVDLGCEYTVTVNSSGDGLLRVAMGWVAFQTGDQEAFIPAGAECVTRRRSGPGIPYYQDAGQAFRQSLAAYEGGRESALGDLLELSRPRDGLTLWHLLTRVRASDRGRVFGRFAQLVAVPAEVTRDAALAKDPRAIDRLWDALNLENADWWRGWERRWQ